MGDDLGVVGDAKGVAEIVAALTRAAGTALDPSSILSRTAAVIEGVVPLERVSLWRTTAEGPLLVATHPIEAPTTERDDADLVLALDGRTAPVGWLAAVATPGASFSSENRALLDLAAGQIAGALERAQLFAEVMELERLKTDFIARVSHELRTPITIINGFLETLLAHNERLDIEQRMHMLERSRVAAARLGDLIEELLILSRIEGGVLTPQADDVDLAELLGSLKATAAEPDQVLVTGSVDGRVRTDSDLLVRALGPLVDNAVKYGGAAEVSTAQAGDRRVIEVRDRGPGFAEDVRHTAFELFTRSKSSGSIAGLGVGLAIARTLIEVLDGTVAIVDVPGPGALVRVSLPA
jgi:signal transduction histidine kinase